MALVADVHGNLEALEAVLADIEQLGIRQIGFLGDAVGYGPDPKSCLDLLRERCAFMLGGNHDRAAAGEYGLARMNDEARMAIIWTGSSLSPEDKRFLAELPLTAEAGECLFAHGSPIRPGQFDYVMSTDQAKAVFAGVSQKLTFFGHSHVPAVYVELEFRRMFAGVSHRVVEKPPDDIELDPGKRFLINVGSAGQPRDGNPAAAYGVFDVNDGRLAIRRVVYDVDRTTDKIRRAGLPIWLAERLKHGL